MFFENLPYLSCPIIRSRENVVQVLISLMKEMERRSDLEYSNPEEWKNLTRIVLVIDEFQALFLGDLRKDTIKSMANLISSILERGRHGKIHIVMAAQNPTYRNMKVDLANLNARAAFKCAREIYSKTIIDEGGAEKLAGHGEMLFRSPDSSTPTFVQGAYIDEKQIKEIAKIVKKKWVNKDSGRFVIQIPATSSLSLSGYKALTDSVKLSPNHDEDERFAQVLLWVFSHDEVSHNAVMKQFHLGWNNVQEIVQKMEALGILGEKRAKLPRKVVPSNLSHLPDELIHFIENNGADRGTIATAFMKRYEPDVCEKFGTQSVETHECKTDIIDKSIENTTEDKDENESVIVMKFEKICMGKCPDFELSDENHTLDKLFSDMGEKRKKELQHQDEIRKKLFSGHHRMLDRIQLSNCTKAIIWTLSQNYVSGRKLRVFSLRMAAGLML